MQARMNNPAMRVPGAFDALMALATAARNGGLPKSTAGLVHLRALGRKSACWIISHRPLPSDQVAFGLAVGAPIVALIVQ